MVFRGWHENNGAQRCCVFIFLILHVFHIFVKVLNLGHARSGNQVRSNNITMQKTLQSRHNYNV